MNKILVVGSSNIDMVVRTDHIPVPGETVLGGKFHQKSGGKGANQAVCCAKLKAPTSIITKTGTDAFGLMLREDLRKYGVNNEHILQDDTVPSGVALITVGKDAENCIVVAPGANACLTPGDIENAQTAFESVEVVLIQLEIPMETVIYTIELAQNLGKKIILNPAPFNRIPPSLFPSLYAITPNQIEAGYLTGIEVKNEADARRAAIVLSSKGVKIIVITMGSQGAYLWHNGTGQLISGYKINAIDTTGAGDAFNGALAVAITRGMEIEESIVFANKTAALTASNLGAQMAMPTLEQVESFQ